MTAIALDRALEALLFVADGPVLVRDLARALEAPLEEVAAALSRLSQESAQRGVCVIRSGERVQMSTAPDTGPIIESFLGISDTRRLSPAATECLAIVAYRQPITRAQIEAFRGVNSDGVLRTLTAHQLIEPAGRLQQAGRPVLYGTTLDFLQYFGIASLAELPSLPELDPAVDPPETAPTES